MNTAVDDSHGQKSVPAHVGAGLPRLEGEHAAPFIGRDELARRLSVHARTVSRMVERGELPRPCMSDGGRPRWLWSFVVEFCHERHMKQAKLEQKLKRKLGESPGSTRTNENRLSGEERIDGTRADTGLSRQGGRA